MTEIDSPPTPEPLPERSCANCGTLTSGRFCRQCGQRLDVHLHSLGHFLSEAGEVLTHADSSLWSTLVPLAIRPGFLTTEFFAGRRVRYLQPFRLYLICSLLFFVLMSVIGNPTIPVRIDVNNRASRAADVADCAKFEWEKVPLGRQLRPRLVNACEKVVFSGGQDLVREVAHNAGRAMFIFLPILAAVMKLLYWRPRRYYLEHLVLLLHNHAFMFLALPAYVLLHWVLHIRGLQVLLTLGFTVYVLRYLYRSLRVVYGQSKLLTAGKFILLVGAYLVCLVAMLVLTMLFSALTL